MEKSTPGKPTDEAEEEKATALAHVEEELARVRKRLAGVTEMARLAYWEHDIINDVYTFNDQFYRIYRTTADEVGGYTMSSEEYARRFIPPEDLPAILAEMRKTIDTGYSRPDRQIEHRILYPDGNTGYVAVSYFLVTDSEGRAARAYGVTQDITELKRTEASLRDEITLRRILVDQSKDGIVVLDRDGNVIEANPQFAQMLGYSLEETLKLHIWDWDAVHSKEALLQQTGTIDETGVHFETRHRRKDGTLIDVEISANGAVYQGRKLIFAVHRDITARKRMEADLKDEITRRRILVEQSKDGIIIVDTKARVIESNQQFANMIGYSLEETLKLHIWDWDAHFTREGLLQLLESIDEGGTHIETRHRRKDGTFIDVEISANGAVYQGQKLIFAVHRDVTERKLVERERQAHFRFLETMDRINQAMQGGVQDLDRIMGDVLDTCLSVFECDRAFLLYPCDPQAPSWSVPMEQTRPDFPGGDARKIPIPMDADVARVLRAALSASGPVSFDPASEHPPTDEFWERDRFRSQMVIALHPKVGKPWLFGLHQCAYPRIWTDAEKALFEKTAQRLSDSLTSLLMYRDLRKNEEFLSKIVENIPDTIFVKDAEELRFLSINHAGEQLLGFSKEELIGKNSFDLLPEEQARRYAESDLRVLEKGMPVDIPEETIRDKDGEPRIIHTKKIPLLDDAGKPQHLLTISEDITNFKRLQAQLSQAQKMEALGTMSGGIAHDFNNILQPMLGYCEFLKEDMPAGSPLQAYVDGIFKSGLRAKELVNQILAFSRQSDRRVIPIELQLVVKEAVKLCRSIISSNIDITQDIQEDCGPIMADPTQLHQIIMNLMVNAYQAMEQTGGEITVILKETRLAEGDLKGSPLPPGRYARLSISDTGCGMAPRVLERIFDPYFTTKAQGKGTGLGLAVVYGIVTEHGGHINIYSEVGKGATFNVYLPIAEEESEALPVEKPQTVRATGREHILLVDDEESIIELEQQVLERLGYRVTSCRHGAEALAAFRRNPKDFHLVITDMNMPNMTGDQLAREVMRVRPEIPVIICTGFSEKIGCDEARAMGVKDFLMKPVAASELSQKVRKALDDSLPGEPG